MSYFYYNPYSPYPPPLQNYSSPQYGNPYTTPPPVYPMSTRSTANENDFLSVLRSLDEAFYIGNSMSQQEYEQSRQRILDNSPTSPASRSADEQSFLQELNTLDEAYYVHKYISKKEHEEYRKKVINKWKGKGQEKKSFWNRMWSKACRGGNAVFKSLLAPIISNLGGSLIGGFAGHSGFIGQ
jgi:hypothetical protein